MTRIILVCQEKGGVGKSLVTRALAEALPDAHIIEIDASPRLIELEGRTSFFSMRADRADIDRSGGRAARAEFDAVLNELVEADKATIVDVGANTSRAFLTVLVGLKDDLAEAGIEIGVLVVATSEIGAVIEIPRLFDLARDLDAKLFLVENRMQGPINPDHIKMHIKGVTVTVLPEHVMEEAAVSLLQARGLEGIPRLNGAVLTKKHGFGTSSRIRRDLAGLRSNAMKAVRPAAEWLDQGK